MISLKRFNFPYYRTILSCIKVCSIVQFKCNKLIFNRLIIQNTYYFVNEKKYQSSGHILVIFCIYIIYRHVFHKTYWNAKWRPVTPMTV